MVLKKLGKKPATVAARAKGFVDVTSGGVIPPLQMSTTFVRDEAYRPVNPENVYGRDHSDQVRLAEDIICTLEGAEDSLLFSSGMAAIAALFNFLRPEDTLLLQSGIYWGTTALARRLSAQGRFKLLEADSSETEKFCSAVLENSPKLIFIETPSNPWIKVSDVLSICSKAKEACSYLIVDATAATPVLMRPILLGADIVMHSATKALNGHSDVTAGVLSCIDSNSSIWEFLRADRHGAGAIVSPHSAWLLIRGLRTLHLRVEKMSENAMKVAEFLDQHPKISEVWYPGLAAHVGHRIAAEQMTGGFGYLLSFLVRGGTDEALAVCQHIKGIHRATSLGGTESLIEHRYTIEGEMTGCPENLLRLSVGIEDLTDLLEELDIALTGK